jgi:hypothetical protein
MFGVIKQDSNEGVKVAYAFSWEFNLDQEESIFLNPNSVNFIILNIINILVLI